MTAVMNELAKIRHLRIGVITITYLVAVVGLTAFQSLVVGTDEHLADPGGAPWKILLIGLSRTFAMISPVLLAVLASRQVEVEHTSNDRLLSTTSGVSSGHLCHVKFTVLGLIVAPVTMIQSALLFGFAKLIGVTSPFPASHQVGYTASIMVINLTVLAFQILLSVMVENQLVALDVGIVGIFLALLGVTLPRFLTHLMPWGYYALAAPTDYVGVDLVYHNLPYLSIAGLAVVDGSLFVLVITRFNTREV